MTDQELKELNQKLWHAADQLRAGAHLSANRYGQPILGLIFLRYADILFKQHSAEIQKEFDRLKKTRMAKSVKKIAIEDQIRNLGIITRLYEGDTKAFEALVAEYRAAGKQAEVDWLLERFPDGKYRDVIGLCKVAKLEGEDGIIDQDYSLNPGRYVGVVIDDDGMTAEEFKAEIRKLGDDFAALSKEAKKLEAEIVENAKGLFA